MRPQLAAMSRALMIVAVLSAAVVADVRAQRLNVTRYDAAAGLPSSRVLSLAQDATGYLWFGTDSGLARYDGTRFQTMPLAPSVRGTRIAALAAVGDTVVYATAEGGLGIVEPGGVRPLVGQGLDAPVRAILVEEGGGLLLATAAGVVEFRGSSTRRIGGADRVPAGCCRAVLRDGAGRIWAAGDRGVYQIRGEDYVLFERGLPGGRPYHVILEDSQGRIWVGGAAGLYRQQGDAFGRVDIGTRQPIVSGRAIGGEVWFGTGDGVVRFHAGGADRLGPAAGLVDSPVHTILGDREGNVWLGSDSGVDKWTPSRFVAYDALHGLPGEYVVGLLNTGDRLFVATRGGVVSRGGEEAGWRAEAEVDRGSGLVVTAVGVAGAELLIGTDRGLIVRGRGGTRTVGDLPVESLLARESAVLVGTAAGLRKLDGGKLVPLLRGGPAATEAVVDMVEDEAGRLWLALGDGSVWREVEGGLEPVPLELEGRPVATVDLAPGGSGVWAATRGAGAWWLGDNGEASRLSRGRNGLASDHVRAILGDGEGGVWLCTTRGLDHWRGDSGITHFDLADGLAALTCSPGAAAMDSTGGIWFGTPRGLTHDAGSPPLRPFPPTVVISSVMAGGAPADYSEQIVLTPDRNDVRIEYSALTYLDEESTLYQYRLLGESDVWSRPTRDRQISFVGLGPGEYLFQVQAISESQLWSAAPAQVHFAIQPRFWQTPWFQAAVAALVLLVLAMAFWRRLRKVDDERQHLRVMVDKRTRELVEKNALLERMATTDELTGLANRRFFLDTMERELRKLTRISTDQQLALLVIDLDRFKSVNDRYGHATGDAVLRHVAQRLAQGVRATDLPARYGGEEFAILLPDTDARGAEFLAEKLRQDVEASPVRDAGHTIRVTISVGVAAIHAPKRYDATIEEDLIRRADEAMYEAKTGGRNRVVVAEPAQASE